MIRRLLPRLLGAASLIALAVLALPALSRPADDDAKELGDVPADLKLVPRDAFMLVSVRVADALESGQGKEALKIAGAKQFLAMFEGAGVAPSSVERLTAFQRRGDQPPLQIVRTTKAYDAAALRKALGADTEHKAHGKTFHAQARGYSPQAVWAADDRTFVFGGMGALVPYLATLAKPGKSHALADELKLAAGKQTATVVLLPSMMLRMGAGFMGDAPRPPRKSKDVMKKDPRKIDGFKGKDDFPPPKDGYKDGKEKFGARAEFLPVRFQKDEGPKKDFRPKDRPRFEGPPAPDPAELVDEPLKLKTLEEAFDAMDGYRGPTSAFFRSSLNCRRLVLTFDIGDEITLNGRGTFAAEAEAKDGVIAGRMLLIFLREGVPMPFMWPPRDEEGPGPFAAFIKSLQDAVRAIEVKQDGKAAVASGKAKIDFSTLPR